MGIREELIYQDLSVVRGKFSAGVNQWIVRNAVGKIAQMLPYIKYFSTRREIYTGRLGSSCRNFISGAQSYAQDMRDCGEEEIADRAEELIICASAGLSFPER